MTQPDPSALLLRLRAECVRLANEIEMMADYPKIGERKPMAARIANRLRDAAMAPDVVAACERQTTAAAKPAPLQKPIILDMGRRFALTKDGEYFGSEGFGGQFVFVPDLANAYLYDNERMVEHDRRVLVIRFPESDVKVIEI